MSDESAALERTASCAVLRAGEPAIGKQTFLYAAAVSAQSAGAAHIHMQLVTMPPGGRAKAHKHEAHETALYILSGRSGMYYGERLEHHLNSCSGDFVYIPANTPHLPYNMSEIEPCIAVVARTDPNDQESVVLLPELDLIHG